MSTPGVEYLAEASRELDETLVWYLERSLTAAEAFLTEIDHGIQLIQQTPQIWPLFEENMRRYVLQKFPYSKREWCIQVIENPIRSEPQEHNRDRFRGKSRNWRDAT